MPQPEENYLESAPGMRPLLMISGDNDPYCSTPILYRYAASYKAPLRLAIIGGNHSLEVGDKADNAMAQRNAANVDLAMRIATDFIKTLFR